MGLPSLLTERQEKKPELFECQANVCFPPKPAISRVPAFDPYGQQLTRSAAGQGPWKFSRSVRRLGGSVKHDGCIEGQTYQAIFGPLHHGGYQDPTFEADVYVGARTEVRCAITHRAAFGNVVQCEAARRSVD